MPEQHAVVSPVLMAVRAQRSGFGGSGREAVPAVLHLNHRRRQVLANMDSRRPLELLRHLWSPAPENSQAIAYYFC